MNSSQKMQVEIWSDVLCPFCYIGKRKFEQALQQFEAKENIEVVWKSFQLDPDFQADSTQSYSQYLQNRKGISASQVNQMFAHVSQMAKEVGLDFHFEKAILANSYLAHRLLHLAKSKGLQNEAEEALFSAHFEQGKDIGDAFTLLELGKNIGLAENEIKKLFESTQFAEEVETDIYEARQIGVRGVPFFVFNRKYAISGAQAGPIFLQTIQKAFTEWEKENNFQNLEVTEGQACDLEGECN